ncbi:MAG: thioredoxin family protein [Methanosarcinales archaeon]|nr:thioredoxin family protein [Methanosarcinales archaeon]
MLFYSKIMRLSMIVALFALAAGMASAEGEGHSVGVGEDDWWLGYPDQHPNAGEDVRHPQWVLEALQSGPVMIYGHGDCEYCAPQTEAVGRLMEQSGDEVEYFNIPSDGSDSRKDYFSVYDPDGGATYVPLTVFVTLVQDSEGEVQVAWHSSEDITGEEWLSSYLEDAIALYQENVADWK